jgi:hypothetical protein
MKFKEWFDDKQKNAPETPAWFYHVTPDPEGILRSGFKTANQLGGGSSVLMGPGNRVSFTTPENAERYFVGMKTWGDAAQGKYDFDELGKNNSLRELEMRLRISVRKIWDVVNQSLTAGRMRDWKRLVDDGVVPLDKVRGDLDEFNERLMFQLLQQIAFETRGKFPLILGSSFPPRLKTAKTIAILRVSSAGPQKVNWNPGEEEWMVFDPENLDLSTLEVVKRD